MIRKINWCRKLFSCFVGFFSMKPVKVKRLDIFLFIFVFTNLPLYYFSFLSFYLSSINGTYHNFSSFSILLFFLSIFVYSLILSTNPLFFSTHLSTLVNPSTLRFTLNFEILDFIFIASSIERVQFQANLWWTCMCNA